jgi:hypothetical protein
LNVLVIPEDFRKDQYILKPIVAAMLEAIGRPRARIQICMDPLLGGVEQATNWERIREILESYSGMVDLFLLCIDRDGDAGRRAALDNIERKAARILASKKRLFAEHAWQELEVWILAGHPLPAHWRWSEIRQEIHPKEKYFLEFAKSKDATEEPGEGRKSLAEEVARNYPRIRQLCSEDVAMLEGRIQTWIATNS